MIDAIYIPTLDRDNQITYDTLPDKYKERVIFVRDRIGIHKVRRKIAYDAGKVNFAVFDDDLLFKRRYVNWKELNCKSKEDFTNTDFDEMFDTIDDIDWDLVKVGEDTNLILEFLTRGYKNRLSDEFLYVAKEYGDVGGCSNYRDEQLNYEEHMKLRKKWPMFVSQMENSKINNWRRFKISWSKAYKYSQQGHLEKI